MAKNDYLAFGELIEEVKKIDLEAAIFLELYI
jgi:hypothetical protein